MFQKKINIVLQEYLNKFIITYFNIIIIYLNNKRDYSNYVKWVL